MRAGLLAGYSSDKFDVDELNSSGHSDDYHLGVYGGAQLGALGFRVGASHSRHEINTSQFAGQFAANWLSAEYHALTAQLCGDLGIGLIKAHSHSNLMPISPINLHSDGFTRLRGAAALTGQGSTMDATFSTPGLRASMRFNFNGIDVLLKGLLGWRHLYGYEEPATVMRFASDSTPVSITGVPIARDVALVEADFDVGLAPHASQPLQ